MKQMLSIGECMIEIASLGGDKLRKGFAGDTFNTAWYARAFLPSDWRVSYFTTLGDDRASDEMEAFIAGAGIGTEFIGRRQGKAPGLYMIHLDGGERSFSYWRSASAARHLADDPQALQAALDRADTIYFSGITLAILTPAARQTLVELLSLQRALGKTIAFDPNIRPRLWSHKSEMLEAITEAARVSTLLLPSFDDEATHFGDADVEATVERYRSLGVETVSSRMAKKAPRSAPKRASSMCLRT
jgi:2-dehydro-3-deoxygluconokinase